MEILKKFGKTVRSHRKAIKLSQEQLAEKCELSPRHITNIENGKANPKLDTVIHICDAFGIDTSALFEQK